MKPALFIGRWQPFHDGHKALIETVLKEGKDVIIACRLTGIDEDNPYSFSERRKMIWDALAAWKDRVVVIPIPDISEVVYGRGVGYGIRQVELDPEVESISGSQIRAEGNAAVANDGDGD